MSNTPRRRKEDRVPVFLHAIYILLVAAAFGLGITLVASAADHAAHARVEAHK